MTEPLYDREAWQKQPVGFLSPPDSRPQPEEASLIEWALWCAPQSVLDVGCLDGRFCRWLRERGYTGRYNGVDVTPAFVSEARRRHPDEKFSVGDVRAELKGQSDLVLCSNVLQHLPSLDPAIGNLFKRANRHVLLAIYGESNGTISHFHSAPFLNWCFSKKAIRDAVPSGWKVERFSEFTPSWDKSKRIHHHLFSRGCGLTGRMYRSRRASA